MSSSRARPRAQPLRQQQQPALHCSDSSLQSTVSSTLRGTSTSVRFEEDTSRVRRSSKSAGAGAEQRSTVLQTAGGRRAENTHLVSLRGSREKRVNFMETEKDLASTSSSPLTLAHELAKTQRELERLRMQLRRYSEHEQQTEEYVSGLEATVEAQRRDNLLLRHHLASRQLLAEVLEEENRDLVEAQQHPIACPQPLITHASTGTMTVASQENAFGDGSAAPSSFSAFWAQMPDRQSSFAGPSPPLSPTQSIPTSSYHHVYGAAVGAHMHELPLHSPTVTALHDRWAQTHLAHEELPHRYADQEEALQRLPSLQQQRNNGANSASIPIRGTTDNPFTSPPPHISVSDETLFSSSTTSSAPQNACTITDKLGIPQQEAVTKHQLRSLETRTRETEHATANALDAPNRIRRNVVHRYPHSDASPSAAGEARGLHQPCHYEKIFPDQYRSPHADLKALQDQIAEQEAVMADLRRQVTQQEAEVAELRQLLAEAQREAQAAGGRQRDSGATVQALRDQMTEQEAEVAELRQLLAEAQRGAPVAGARSLESGATVQALRDQMAEQEAEVAELRQLLAEAQRGAPVAAARSLESGATVQALRDQVAQQEAEVAELRQLLAEAQRDGVSRKVAMGQEERSPLLAGAAVVLHVEGVADRGVVIESLCEGSEGKRDALGWFGDGGSMKGGIVDDGRGVSSSGGGGERELLAGAGDRRRSVSETEELRSALAECREKFLVLEVELMTAKEAVEELRWYDERRDNCVEGKPLCQTCVRRRMEGEGWALVASVCEEELIWRLRVDCSRACHVNVDRVRHVKYALGSLHAEFCVEHNTDVEGSELKDRIAEYPFPATWALFRRIVEGHTLPDPMRWAVPSRAEEKLLAEEALARIFAQLEEACACQAFTSDWSEKRTDLLRAAKAALAEVVAASRRECTDSLERLEEFAALLLEARESERELRDRLFAAEEDMYELRRQHDDDRDGLVSAEAEARRSLDMYVARVAAQDEAMRVQVEQIVDLQEEVQVLTSALSDKNADLTDAHAQASALSRQVDETAAAYADTLEKLEKSVEMLDASRTNELVLSQTLYEAEYRCTQLRKAIEMDAATHRVELVSATSERDRFKEGIEVFRELLPNLLAAAQPQRRKDSGDAGAGVDESISISALDAAFSGEGYAVAQGLREVLLHHLSRVEQLRRDKEGLADELDEAEKVCGTYMAALKDALRSLVEERELRMQAHESQLQFSEQMMRELAMMRNAEEDEMADDKADMEVNSNYGLPSTCSSSNFAV